MARAIPTLGYPSRMEAALALREQQHLKTPAIARALGIKPNSVGNLIRQARLAREEKETSYRTERLDPRQRARIQAAARRRKISARQLVDDLLRIIADEQLIDAILDDRERA